MQKWLWDITIQVLYCPSQLPNLNMIKNQWGELKRAFDMRKPKKLNDFERIYIKEWFKILPNVCLKLVTQCRKRLHADVRSHGGCTKHSTWGSNNKVTLILVNKFVY